MKRALIVLGFLLIVAGFGLLTERSNAVSQELAQYKARILQDEAGASVPVGKFPANMDAIVDLIRSTKSKLVIVCDYAGYGHYSQPEKFDRYFDSIRNVAMNNETVDMYVYDHDAAEKAQRLQLGLNTDSQLLDPDDATLKRWMAARRIEIAPKTMGDLNGLLFEWQRKYQEAFRNARVQLHTVSFTLPVHMWRNDTEAIYSLYNLGIGPREVSFKTRNKETLAMLDKIYEDIQNNKVPDLSRADVKPQ